MLNVESMLKLVTRPAPPGLLTPGQVLESTITVSPTLIPLTDVGFTFTFVLLACFFFLEDDVAAGDLEVEAIDVVVVVVEVVEEVEAAEEEAEEAAEAAVAVVEVELTGFGEAKARRRGLLSSTLSAMAWSKTSPVSAASANSEHTW